MAVGSWRHLNVRAHAYQSGCGLGHASDDGRPVDWGLGAENLFSVGGFVRLSTPKYRLVARV
jgi:hypothetical protein